MPSYRLTCDAQSGLIDVRRYTFTQWGESQSNKYLSELRQTIKLLSDTPALGKQRSDIAAGAFSFPHASHIIYYILDKHQLVVFGVLHKRMVPLHHLENRETI